MKALSRWHLKSSNTKMLGRCSMTFSLLGRSFHLSAIKGCTPARHAPASRRPKPCAYPWKRPTNLAHSPLLVGPCRKKTDRGHISFSLRNLPVRAFDSCAQGFSTPLARRRSSCLPTSPNLVRNHPIERYQALRDSTPCLSRATTS